ncbi:hypothetical protein [Vibrio vulnificus]|uniref:hypothetical protein n=1 Tax=Vibrio vulnificus TaxID=672 RepID=UPI00092B5113|nr:hypothetical protein VVS316_01151 [Vibrio vulnificus]
MSEIAKQALLCRGGAYGALIALEECFEQADWRGIEQWCEQLGLSIEEVRYELAEAQRWSQEFALI